MQPTPYQPGVPYPPGPPQRGRRTLVVVLVACLAVVLAGVGVVGYLVVRAQRTPDLPANWPSAGFTVSGDAADRAAAGEVLVLLADDHARYSVRPRGVVLAVPPDRAAALRRVRAALPLRTDLAVRPVVGTPSSGGAADCPLTGPALCDRSGTRYQVGASVLTGGQVHDAVAAHDATIGWYVTLSFTESGRTAMAAATKAHTGGQLAIVLAGLVLSAPTVQGPIDGDLQITGGISSTDAKRLAQAFRLARHPVRIASGNPG